MPGGDNYTQSQRRCNQGGKACYAFRAKEEGTFALSRCKHTSRCHAANLTCYACKVKAKRAAAEQLSPAETKKKVWYRCQASKQVGNNASHVISLYTCP